MVEMRLLFIVLFLVSVALLHAAMRELNKYSPRTAPAWLIILGMVALTAVFTTMTIMMVI